MRKGLKIILSVFILISILLSGCKENDGGNFIFKYDITGNPRTLDPQTAAEENSLLIISNLFEGLLKLDQNGDIIAGVAGEYTVSDDGLEYVFYLREDVYWYAGKDENNENDDNDTDYEIPCTAYDFVFAFRRLFNPATKSSNAEPFFCIKNAEQINKGNITDLTQLGIIAEDDYMLKFILDYPNPLFTNLLTTAPAMPCNQALYDRAAGRYGLTAASVPSNGAFYLFKWNYDKYSSNNNNLILRRNTKNSESDRVYPYGLNFFIDEPDVAANFLDGANHSVILSGNKAVELINAGYPHDDFENSVWGVVFNTKGVFKNEKLRYALAASIDRTRLDINDTGYRIAEMLIPNIVRLGGKSFRSISEQKLYIGYDLDKAKINYEAGADEAGYKNLSGLNLLAPQNDEILKYLGYLTQQWQAGLGFFCNIKEMPQSTINSLLLERDFDFAVVKISGEYNSPSAFLRQFTGNTNNPSGYSNNEYITSITKAERAAEITESAEYYKQAEKILLDGCVFIPLCFQTEYFIYNKNCQDIIYNPFTGSINYREAKYFG